MRICAGWLLLGLCLFPSSLVAQDANPGQRKPGSTPPVLDTVVFHRPRGLGTLTKQGTITRWRGRELVLATNGRELQIDNETLVSVQTRWPVEYLEARSLVSQGRLIASCQKFSAALEAETRPWAKRAIRSKLIGPLMVLGKIDAAAFHYTAILSEDRDSQYLYLAPLAWSNDPIRFGKASQWVNAEESIVQLIGASWNLNSPDRGQRATAIKRLESLTNDSDPRIKNLAIGQLWRTRASSNERQNQVWKKLVDQMPQAIQAGPLLTLGIHQARAGQRDAALISWMKIISLHADQPALVSAALYQSAKLLHQNARRADADPQLIEQQTVLLNELKTRFPESELAQRAQETLTNRDR